MLHMPRAATPAPTAPRGGCFCRADRCCMPPAGRRIGAAARRGVPAIGAGAGAGHPGGAGGAGGSARAGPAARPARWWQRCRWRAQVGGRRAARHAHQPHAGWGRREGGLLCGHLSLTAAGGVSVNVSIIQSGCLCACHMLLRHAQLPDRSLRHALVQVRALDGTVVDADYVRLVMAAMGAAEIVQAADWVAVARSPRSVPWCGRLGTLLAACALGVSSRKGSSTVPRKDSVQCLHGDCVCACVRQGRCRPLPAQAAPCD